MAKCDLCNETVSASSMEALRDLYRTDTVRDLCPSCMKWANDELDKIRDSAAPELKRRIAARALPKPRRRWLWPSL